jgi:hypothetical protein
MPANAWLRLADDRLVPTHRVAAVDLWGPPAQDQRTEVVAGQPARIMARVDGLDRPWELVSPCAAERGGELITGLLATLAAAGASTEQVTFVYGLHHRGELSRWTHGRAIPLTDPRVPAFHEVSDPAPGRWLVARSNTER